MSENAGRDAEGQLHEWGSRLFWGKVKGKPEENTAVLAQALLAMRPSGEEIRARIRSVVTPGGKQVMVKITGGGRGMGAIRAHMRYISRLGKDEAGGRGRRSSSRMSEGTSSRARKAWRAW